MTRAMRSIGAKLIPYQPADRRNPKRRGGNVRDRGIRGFQDDSSHRLLGGQRDRHTAAERKAPDDNAVRTVSRRRKGIGGRRVREQPVLARLSTRAGIAAIGQRDDAGPVSDDVAKAAEEAGQKIAIAVKIEHDRMARLRRNVPDDDLLAIRRGENMLFSFRKTGRLGRRAHRLRYRKDERALREEQHRKTAEIADRCENDEPFQDGHRFPRIGLTSP